MTFDIYLHAFGYFFIDSVCVRSLNKSVQLKFDLECIYLTFPTIQLLLPIYICALVDFLNIPAPTYVSCINTIIFVIVQITTE